MSSTKRGDRVCGPCCRWRVWRLARVRARDIAFVLGPRINAAGRLESAMSACRLLMTSDTAEAAELALELQALNERRRSLTLAAQRDIQRELEALDDSALIFTLRRDISSGIAGLVAGRLCEDWQRPAVVLEHGAQESRASCRSIPQFDIIQALDQCADLLLRHGGHAQAAGFTVHNENLPALQDRLTQLAGEALEHQALLPALDIDAEVTSAGLTMALLDELAQLEPTGSDNPPALLLLRNARIRERRRVGREGSHLKLRLESGARSLDAIAFRQGERAGKLPVRVDLAFELERNDWNGRRRLQLNVQDIRPAQGV